jgi:hypothetical protein
MRQIFIPVSVLMVILVCVAGWTKDVSAGVTTHTLGASTYRLVKDKSGYDRIEAEGFHTRFSPGEPLLPRNIYNIAVPPNASLESVKLKIVSSTPRVLEGAYDMAPAGPNVTSISGGEQKIAWGKAKNVVNGKDVDVYGANVFFPDHFVRLVSYSQLRKWKFVKVAFFPFQYNPVSKKLRLIESVTIDITYDELAVMQSQSMSEDTVMDPMAREILFNYDQAQTWYEPGDTASLGTSALGTASGTYDYVIITTNAIVSESSRLTDFIDHKSQTHNVLVVTEDDFDGLTGQTPNTRAERIRQWLINNYQDLHIWYVLLIGDPTPDGNDDYSIPMKMCWPRRHEVEHREAPTDYFYADLTGDWDKDGDHFYGEYAGDYDGVAGGVDFSPEVYVGRIPYYGPGAARLDGILDKIVDYETEIIGSVNWRKNILLPMSFSDEQFDGAVVAEQMKDDYLDGAGFSAWRMYQQGQGPCEDDSVYTSEEELRGNSVRSRLGSQSFGIVAWKGHGGQEHTVVGYGEDCEDGILLERFDTFTLDNNRPFFTYQCSCNNGFPENSNNLQYAILRNGGVATVGATRVSWYNRYEGYGDFDDHHASNASIGYEYVQNLIAETWASPAGSALYHAKSCQVLETAQDLMNMYDFNLYGDPTVGLDSYAKTTAYTYPASNVFYNSATLNGFLFSLGQTSVDVSFEWGTTLSYGNETPIQATSTPGFYSAVLTGLTGNTLYHFRAKAAGETVSYGRDMSFVTPTREPIVITRQASNVSKNSATLNGQLQSLGSASSAQVSFEWGETIPGEVLDTYPVGNNPFAVMYANQHIWVANAASDSVSKLRVSDGHLMGTYPVGDTPVALASDGVHVWVANRGDGTVTKLMASDGFVVDTYPVGNFPSALTFDGTDIWVATYGPAPTYVNNGHVTRIRTTDGAQLATYEVGRHPSGLASDGHVLYVSNFYDDQVMRLRLSDGDLVDVYDVGKGPTGLAYDWPHLWVLNSDALQISAEGPSVMKVRVADAYILGDYWVGESPRGLVLHGGYVWVADEGEDVIRKIRASDGALWGTYPVGEGPCNLDSDGQNLWVVNQLDNTVMKVRGAGYENETVLETMSIPGSFSADLIGLDEGITYQFRAKAEGVHGAAVGDDFTFVARSLIHVPDDFATIEEAIDAASDGNTVLVADNVYTGPGNRNLELDGKAITVRSENGPESCIIDCQGLGIGFYVHENEGPDSVISGFTIRNGDAMGFTNMGGGIYSTNASPTITDCIIEYNSAGDSAAQGHNGGGIYCYGGSPTIASCIVRNNTAQRGGGIYLSDALATVTDCVIQDNTAGTTEWWHSGGGVYCTSGSSTLERCAVKNNSAYSGGGISGGNLRIDACTITENEALHYGGGVQGGAILTNSVIAGNDTELHGGGLYGSGVLTNCTFFANTAGDLGGGLYASSSGTTLTNCVVWQNTSDGSVLNPISYGAAENRPVVTYSDVQGGYSGDGNINEYPYFLDASGSGADYWDLRLQCDSPCVDVGNNDAPEITSHDLDGRPRIFDCNGGAVPVVDMGAFEFPFHRSQLERGTVSPSSGDPNTWFRFSVDYHHPDGLEPMIKNVVINGTAYPMDLQAGYYFDGTYVYDAHLPTGVTYYFLFQDENGCSVRLPAEGTFDGPDVTNQCPLLSLGQVSPETGDTTTLFRVTVDYLDPDGTPPAWAKVVINNDSRNMALLSGTADNGTYYLDTLMEPDSVYYFSFDDGFGCPVRLPETGTFEGPVVTGMTSYVPDDYPDISTAVNHSNSYDVIIVRDGVYRGDNNKNIAFDGKVLTLRSENGPFHCIVDCEGSGRGFDLGQWGSSGSVIDGFTIINGSTTGSGGGIYAEGSVTIRNCRIIENNAQNGGGIYLGNSTAGSVIVNCLILANTANTASGYGGGIFLETMLHPALPGTINHCSVVNNAAYYAGGVGHLNFSTPYCNIDMTNTILWGNSATYGPQVAASDWMLGSLSYCNVEGGEGDIHGTVPWGDGNISAPPLFVDTTPLIYTDWNMRLQTGSPCIDAGTNEAPEILESDLEGHERIWDGDENGTTITDMGAFECNAPMKGDFDNDSDIDGSDLASLAEDLGLVEINQFAKSFGTTYLSH